MIPMSQWSIVNTQERSPDGTSKTFDGQWGNLAGGTQSDTGRIHLRSKATARQACLRPEETARQVPVLQAITIIRDSRVLIYDL
jgi:hypothetical protein